MVANSTALSERSVSSTVTTSPPKLRRDSGKPDLVNQTGSGTTPDLAIASTSSEVPIRRRLTTIKGEHRSARENSNAPRDALRLYKNAGHTTSPNSKSAARPSNSLAVISPGNRTAEKPNNRLELTGPSNKPDALRHNISG